MSDDFQWIACCYFTEDGTLLKSIHLSNHYGFIKEVLKALSSGSAEEDKAVMED
jgi:hypothetical protein